MCGRVTQTDKDLPGIKVAVLDEDYDSRTGEPVRRARYNGSPGQDFWVIRRHPETGAYHRDRN
jgi:hypothetical protein